VRRIRRVRGHALALAGQGLSVAARADEELGFTRAIHAGKWRPGAITLADVAAVAGVQPSAVGSANGAGDEAAIEVVGSHHAAQDRIDSGEASRVARCRELARAGLGITSAAATGLERAGRAAAVAVGGVAVITLLGSRIDGAVAAAARLDVLAV